MTVAAEWISDVELILLGGRRPTLNKLNAVYNAAATTLTLLNDPGEVGASARVAIDLEVFHVWSVTGQVATVDGAQEGSANVGHANGSYVYVNPIATKFEILRAINATLRSLSSPANGLYQVKAVDLTASATQVGYDITGSTDVIDILEVSSELLGGWQDWDPLSWRLERNMSTSEFASGSAILFEYGRATAGQAVRVRYKSGFASLAALADDVATTGLPVAAYDIPALGAAMRLMSGREIRRNQLGAQNDPRSSQEVPPGAVLNSYRGVAAEFQRRVREEAARLRTQYPARQRVL